MDTTALLWDWQHLRQQVLAARAVSVKTEALWQQLGQADAKQSHQALLALAKTPQETVALLKAHLKPVAPADPAQLAQRLKDLDDKRFLVRERALAELEKLDELARPALEKGLQVPNLPLEVRRRLETP